MSRFLLLCYLLSLFSFSPAFSANENSITGLWKSRDQHSDRPRSLVVIYEYEGRFYGRMLATYDENGQIGDTIFTQTGKAPGVVGNPPYCGMDFIYNVQQEGNSTRYSGKIIDPEQGNVYNAEFWRKGDLLIVRGEVFIFGKTIPWQPASTKDLPKGFKMKEVKSFVPVIPIVK